MNHIDKNTLEKTGFDDTSSEDYLRKKVILRDGRSATVWTHKVSGHGILDVQIWEEHDYYSENYRKDFSAKIEESVQPSEHMEIYEDLNERQFQTFKSYLTNESKFLEVGCSYGGILKKVSNSGVEICHAVEPNKIDADFVSRNNKKSKIFNSTLEDAKLPDTYYDVVVSIEVLEHVVSPRIFLKKCFDVLSDNGFIHIEVPNHDDVLLSVYNNPGYRNFYYHKAHIHNFTKESLYSLCRECGFNGDVSSFLMYQFFNHVWWYQNSRPQSSPTTALSTPTPINTKLEVGERINSFYKQVEKDYESLINENMLGDCLIFQGRKKG